MAVPNFIDKMMNDERNTVFIGNDNGIAIKGYVDAETVFGATASYGALSQNSAVQGVSDAVKQISEFTDIIDAGNTFDPPWMTMQTWQNSSVGDLSFSLYYVATSYGDDVLQAVLPVYDMVLPEVEDDSFDRFITPLSYAPKKTKGQSANALNVQIGDWFYASGFVMTSASITVSKEKINENGTLPLYVKVDVSLLPTKVFSATEVKDWFY